MIALTLAATLSLAGGQAPAKPPAAPAPDLPKRYLAAKPKPDAVLAKVGGVPIRGGDLEAYLWDWRAFEAVQDLITHQMIVAEAKRLKLVEDPAAIERELSRQLDAVRSRLQTGQTLSHALLTEGFPKSRLWMRIRTEHLLDQIVLKSFNPKAYIKVSTIIIRKRSPQTADLAEAIKKADEAYASLRNGEPWGDALARFTEDASTLQNQGLLGWRELSAFPEVVQQEMKALRVGGVTRPAETANGIQIFRIEGNGSEAQGPQLQELKDAYRLGGRVKVLEELRKRTKIEVFLGK